MSIYLRPVAFIDTPVGFDGTARRLAGGLQWFSAVEVITGDGGQLQKELVPVSQMDERAAAIGMSETWAALTAVRRPLQLGARTVRIDQPQVVGIVNATPDSFSDGGRFAGSGVAVQAGHDQASAGAAIIDIGGESTRPGAAAVWEGDEWERVANIMQPLAAAGHAVSIDTRKAFVMERAIAAGSAMVNDVSALTFDTRAAEVVAGAGCVIVLMHHQGSPETMQQAPSYGRPVLLEVYDWLAERIAAAEAAGIARERIVVDPGFGFGKSVAHNLQLMNGLAMLHGLGCPLMVGASRKRTIGALAGEVPADQRLGGSLTLALKAAEQGVQLVRVHDVPETVQALRVWRGLRDAALAGG